MISARSYLSYKITIYAAGLLLSFSPVKLSSQSGDYIQNHDYRIPTGDSLKIVEMVISSRKHVRLYPDSTLKMANRALQLAKKLKYHYGMGIAHHLVGKTHYIKREVDASVDAINKAIPFLKKSKAFHILGDCYSLKGANYEHEGDFKNAISNFELNAQTFENINPTDESSDAYLYKANGLVRAYLRLHACYMSEGKHKAALKFLRKSQKVRNEQGIIDAFIFSSIGRYYQVVGEIDSSIIYYKRGIENCIEVKRYPLLASLYSHVISQYIKKGKLDLAQENIKALKELATKNKYHIVLAEAHSYSGEVNQALGNHEDAIMNYDLALETARKYYKSVPLSNLCRKVGSFYRSVGLYDLAQSLLDESFTLIHESDYYLKALVYIEKAKLKLQTGDVSEGRKLLESGASLGRKVANTSNRANVQFQIAEYLKDINDPDTADSSLVLYQSALKEFKADTLKVRQLKCERGIGEVLLTQGKVIESISHFNRALDLTKELKTKEEWYKIHQLLSYAHEKEENHELALLNYKRFSVLKDSVISADVRNELNNIQIKYESKNKDDQIAVLEKQSIRQKKQLNISIIIGVLAILTIFLTGYILYMRYRLKQKLEQHRLLNEERQRLSNDLHDDISSTLSSISMVSSFASEKLNNGERDEATKLVKDISSSSLQMGEELNDLIWALNPKKETLGELTDRINNYAAPMANSKEIKFNLEVDHALRNIPLSIELRKNLFLINKEAINNAIKYSGSNLLKFTVASKSRELIFTVEDDGYGFDEDLLNAQGNGLYNMKHRAESIKANFKIISIPQKGTTITTSVLV